MNVHVSRPYPLGAVCAATLAALAFCANASADEGSTGLVQPVDVSAIVESALAEVPLPDEIVATTVATVQAAESAPVQATVPPPPQQLSPPPAAAPPRRAKKPAPVPDSVKRPPPVAVPAARYQPVAPQYHQPATPPAPPPPAPDAPPAPAAAPARPVAGSCAGTGDALQVVCGVLREIGSNSGLQFLSRYQTDLSQYQPQTDPTTTAQPAPAPDAVSLLELGDSIVGALEDQLVEPLAGSAPPVQHAPERRAPGPAARTVEPLHGLGPGPPATPQRVRGPEAGERTGPASPVPAAARPASRGDARARAPAAEPVPAHRPALERPPPPEPLTTPSSSGAPAGGASAGSFGSGSGGAGAVASLTALFLLALLDQLRRLRLESSQPRSVHVASFPERPG